MMYFAQFIDQYTATPPDNYEQVLMLKPAQGFLKYVAIIFPPNLNNAFGVQIFDNDVRIAPRSTAEYTSESDPNASELGGSIVGDNAKLDFPMNYQLSGPPYILRVKIKGFKASGGTAGQYFGIRFIFVIE